MEILFFRNDDAITVDSTKLSTAEQIVQMTTIRRSYPRSFILCHRKQSLPLFCTEKHIGCSRTILQYWLIIWNWIIVKLD